MSQTAEQATVESSPNPRAREPRPTAWNRFADAMRMYLTEGDAEMAREALIEALGATKMAKVGKDLYDEVPDHQVRSAVAVKILEWAQGRPTETVQITTNGGPAKRAISAGDLHAMLQERPELAGEILEGIVRSAKPVEPVDDEPVTQQPAQKQLIGNQSLPRA